MTTTIQISDEVKNALDKMKIFQRETYNEIIEVMIEDHLEINEETKRDVEEARNQVRKGNTINPEEVMQKFGL